MRASSRPNSHDVNESRRTRCASTLSGMKIDVVPFGDTDEAAIRQAYEISRASSERDVPDLPPPSEHTFVSGIHQPHPGHLPERAIGYLDGQPAGYLCLEMPQLDNLDNATVDLSVTPALRRHGVGRALHAHAVQRARALNRKRLSAETVQGPGSDAFAAAMGSSPALAETRSRLDLRAVDQDRLDAMLAEAWTHAGGYRFVKWDGVPPDEFIDDVAALDSRFMSDAPLGDLDWEPEKVDADRVRKSEQQRLERGFGRFTAAPSTSPAAGSSPGPPWPGRVTPPRTSGRTSPSSTRHTAGAGWAWSSSWRTCGTPWSTGRS